MICYYSVCPCPDLISLLTSWGHCKEEVTIQLREGFVTHISWVWGTLVTIQNTCISATWQTICSWVNYSADLVPNFIQRHEFDSFSWSFNGFVQGCHKDLLYKRPQWGLDQKSLTILYNDSTKYPHYLWQCSQNGLTSFNFILVFQFNNCNINYNRLSKPSVSISYKDHNVSGNIVCRLKTLEIRVILKQQALLS